MAIRFWSESLFLWLHVRLFASDSVQQQVKRHECQSIDCETDRGSHKVCDRLLMIMRHESHLRISQRFSSHFPFTRWSACRVALEVISTFFCLRLWCRRLTVFFVQLPLVFARLFLHWIFARRHCFSRCCSHCSHRKRRVDCEKVITRKRLTIGGNRQWIREWQQLSSSSGERLSQFGSWDKKRVACRSTTEWQTDCEFCGRQRSQSGDDSILPFISSPLASHLMSLTISGYCFVPWAEKGENRSSVSPFVASRVIEGREENRMHGRNG